MRRAAAPRWPVCSRLKAVSVSRRDTSCANGDIPSLSNAWRLEAVDAQGAPLVLTGHTSEVARRQPDSSWRYVIDHPNGAERCAVRTIFVLLETALGRTHDVATDLCDERRSQLSEIYSISGR